MNDAQNKEKLKQNVRNLTVSLGTKSQELAAIQRSKIKAQEAVRKARGTPELPKAVEEVKRMIRFELDTLKNINEIKRQIAMAQSAVRQAYQQKDTRPEPQAVGFVDRLPSRTFR